MVLRIGHGTGFKPAIKNFAGTLVFFAVLLNNDFVHKMLVQIRKLYARKIRKFLNGTHGNHLAIVRNPHRKRRAPETVPRNIPVAGIIKPLPETTILNMIRHPVHLLIALDHPLLQRLHHPFRIRNLAVDLQKPSLQRAVKQRHASTPAMRVTMHNRIVLEHATLFLKERNNGLVRILRAHALPLRHLIRKLALFIQRIKKTEAQFCTELKIFLTKTRRNMHRPRTIFRTHESRRINLVTAGKLFRSRERIRNTEQGLVRKPHQVRTLASIQHERILEIRSDPTRRHPELFPLVFHQVIIHVRAHGNRKVRRQCPRRRRPHQHRSPRKAGLIRCERENQSQRRILTILVTLIRLKV